MVICKETVLPILEKRIVEAGDERLLRNGELELYYYLKYDGKKIGLRVYSGEVFMVLITLGIGIEEEDARSFSIEHFGVG